jgi:hypothetical protein
MNALIGSTGFVGGVLRRQWRFHDLYNSANIADIAGRTYELAVCAAAPAQKWIANREPDADKQNILRLMEHLRSVRCGCFVLISTVDVFQRPVQVDEATAIELEGLHAYGLHRWMLEEFVRQTFPDHLVIRLPALVGPGLRKNALYDLHHGNRLEVIDSRGEFQFYPMVNLGADIVRARAEALRLVHLTSVPISLSDIATECFGRQFTQVLPGTPVRYDFRTRYAAAFDRSGPYQYDRREVLQAVRSYAQWEPRRSPPEPT